MLPFNDTRAYLTVVLIILLSTTVSAEVTRLENELIRVDVNGTTGCFTVTEKTTGHVWQPDPWQRSAAVLRIRKPNWQSESWNLSQCRKIEVTAPDERSVRVTFRSPVTENGQVVAEASVTTQLKLASKTADLECRVLNVTGPSGYLPTQLEFPARHFSLITEQDRGMAVIPYMQGVVVPSYLFPMRNSKFAICDDFQHSAVSLGELELYAWEGLSMPWFGICREVRGGRSHPDGQVGSGMQYILNYNDKTRINQSQGIESPYPRILSLTPVWDVQDLDPTRIVRYHFLPRGNHVSVAKYYREVAKERGLFVSLREKATRTPAIEKMKGDIYLHVYGGFPHYVNFPGMAFHFRQLEKIVRDLHDNLDVERAFITAWGTWENYPPHHWPINKRAGGQAGLKRAFDLAKSYGYLITPYHTWHALLEHDPRYDRSLLPPGKDGRSVIRGRWSAVDPKHWHEFAQDVLPKELAAIGSNACYSDGHQTPELIAYLKSLNLPMTMEHVGDCELYVPDFHRFEGIAPYNRKDSRLSFVEAPLFNLVYGDAVMTTNRCVNKKEN